MLMDKWTAFDQCDPDELSIIELEIGLYIAKNGTKNDLQYMSPQLYIYSQFYYLLIIS